MALTQALIEVDDDGQERVCGYVITDPPEVKGDNEGKYLLVAPEDTRV